MVGIKGFNFPTNCAQCKIGYFTEESGFYVCPLTKLCLDPYNRDDAISFQTKIHENCPLVELEEKEESK